MGSAGVGAGDTVLVEVTCTVVAVNVIGDSAGGVNILTGTLPLHICRSSARVSTLTLRTRRCCRNFFASVSVPWWIM